MSTSRPFTDAELYALTPWRLPEAGPFAKLLETEQAAEPEVTAPEEPAFTMPTAEEIEAMQKQAYDEAFAQGQAEGYQAGHSEGLTVGREAGYQAGHSEGYAAGCAAGQEELAALQTAQGEQLHAVLSQLQQPFSDLDEAVEQELVALVVTLAKQVIRHELRSDPGLVLTMVRGAIAALPSAARQITVFLHPDDVEVVRSALTQAEADAQWKLLADGSLERGGCRIVAEPSVIDARLERRLNMVIAQFLGESSEEPVA